MFLPSFNQNQRSDPLYHICRLFNILCILTSDSHNFSVKRTTPIQQFRKMCRWRLLNIISILTFFDDFLRTNCSEIPISLRKHILIFKAKNNSIICHIIHNSSFCPEGKISHAVMSWSLASKQVSKVSIMVH